MPDMSDKHSPKVDDEIGRETQGMVSGGHPTHAEEFKETEPFSDDAPADPTRATVGEREGSRPG